MKHASLLLLLTSLLLTACGANGLYQVTLITDGDHELTGNYAGDLLILGGQTTLSPDAALQGSAHLISGQLVVQGQIFGDVTLLGGDLTLGPFARLNGNLNLGGGAYHPAPGSVIAGRIHTGANIPLPDLPERDSPTLGGTLLQTLLNAILLGLTAWFLARTFPNGVKRVSDAATQHTLVCGSVGLLVGVVGISLLVTMAYTILLIPVTVLGLLVLGLAIVLGWVGLGITAGRLVELVLKRSFSAEKSAFSGTLVFMIVLELLSSIPLIGGLLAIVVAAIGLGAVSLTRFGFQIFVPATE